MSSSYVPSNCLQCSVVLKVSYIAYVCGHHFCQKCVNTMEQKTKRTNIRPICRGCKTLISNFLIVPPTKQGKSLSMEPSKIQQRLNKRQFRLKSKMKVSKKVPIEPIQLIHMGIQTDQRQFQSIQTQTVSLSIFEQHIQEQEQKNPTKEAQMVEKGQKSQKIGIQYDLIQVTDVGVQTKIQSQQNPFQYQLEIQDKSIQVSIQVQTVQTNCQTQTQVNYGQFAVQVQYSCENKGIQSQIQLNDKFTQTSNDHLSFLQIRHFRVNSYLDMAIIKQESGSQFTIENDITLKFKDQKKLYQAQFDKIYFKKHFIPKNLSNLVNNILNKDCLVINYGFTHCGKSTSVTQAIRLIGRQLMTKGQRFSLSMKEIYLNSAKDPIKIQTNDQNQLMEFIDNCILRNRKDNGVNPNSSRSNCLYKIVLLNAKIEYVFLDLAGRQYVDSNMSSDLNEQTRSINQTLVAIMRAIDTARYYRQPIANDNDKTLSEIVPYLKRFEVTKVLTSYLRMHYDCTTASAQTIQHLHQKHIKQILY